MKFCYNTIVRSKRLIILLAVFGIICAVIIIMSAIFTIYSTEAKCLTNYGEDNSIYTTIESVNREVKSVSDEFRYGNIFLLDEQKVLDAVNKKVAKADAVDVESVFPNKIIVKYYLITEDLQFKVNDEYYVCGENGKILRHGKTDYAKTSDTIISVTPFTEPTIAENSTHVYTEAESYDMKTLKTILSLSNSLVSEGRRAFDKSAYESIDLSNKNSVKIKMRKGVSFRLDVSEDKLADAVQAMVSWYVDMDESKLFSGEVILSYNAQADKIMIYEK